jgi:hypothetical protein
MRIPAPIIINKNGNFLCSNFIKIAHDADVSAQELGNFICEELKIGCEFSYDWEQPINSGLILLSDSIDHALFSKVLLESIPKCILRFSIVFG